MDGSIKLNQILVGIRIIDGDIFGTLGAFILVVYFIKWFQLKKK